MATAGGGGDQAYSRLSTTYGRGALGRAVEHSTSDYWVTGSKPGVFMSGALSSFVSSPGDRSVAHKTLAVKKRR